MNKNDFENKFVKAKHNWIETNEDARIYGNDYEILDDSVLIFKENLYIADIKLSRVKNVLNKEIWQ